MGPCDRRREERKDGVVGFKSEGSPDLLTVSGMESNMGEWGRVVYLFEQVWTSVSAVCFPCHIRAMW